MAGAGGIGLAARGGVAAFSGGAAAARGAAFSAGAASSAYSLGASGDLARPVSPPASVASAVPGGGAAIAPFKRAASRAASSLKGSYQSGAQAVSGSGGWPISLGRQRGPQRLIPASLGAAREARRIDRRRRREVG